MQVTRVICTDTLLSSVHRGTAFEKRSLILLREHLSMSLTRVGGKADGGVDLMGWWWVPHLNCRQQPAGVPAGRLDASLPSQRRRIRVLAQCKAEKKKMGPAYLRELEGVVYKYVADPSSYPLHTPASPTDAAPDASSHPLVALLISQSPFTRACLLAAHSSPVPLLLINLPLQSTPGEAVDVPDNLGTAFGNAALVGATGTLGGDVEVRWERHPGGGGRPGLWWKGQRLESWTPED